MRIDRFRVSSGQMFAESDSAEFDCDAKGRPTDVWKINRTTQTLAYDSIGRAVEVQDASGKVFETTYDLDGVVQSVYRTDTSNNLMIVGYTYGTTGLENGMVTAVTDGLSGVAQTFTYETSGGGKGQVASVLETNGSAQYAVSYTYNGAGERETATYDTPNGTTKWKYSDYVRVGHSDSPSRVFQTLTKLDGSGNPTSEEFHYAYDFSGRLRNATFAMTPQSGQSGYSSSYPADTRGRAYYTYDPAGRITNLEHYWDDWGGSTYASTPILGNHCDYELTGANRGLKTANSFYVNNNGSWALDRTEYYGYDADLDYLTSADYNDGQANENPSWSYDAGGNRNDATVVDNLNRATVIGGVSLTYDILGNRLTKGSSIVYGWDAMRRMTSFTSGLESATYQYRADGMRTKKVSGAQSDWYFYDDQLPIETSELTSSSVVITRNGIGARGIDRIERTGSSTTIGYPVYDPHGNMIATLHKSIGSYSINDIRTYDAWGVIRQGTSTGDPKGRYCATLGHVADDESSLIYMRARFYEPSSARFLSQDDARDGLNWYSYCANDPVNRSDKSGNDWTDAVLGIFSILRIIGSGTELISGSFKKIYSTVSGSIVMTAGLTMLAAWFFVPGEHRSFGKKGDRTLSFTLQTAFIPAFFVAGLITCMEYGAMSSNGIAREVQGAVSAYSLTIALFIAFDSICNS